MKAYGLFVDGEYATAFFYPSKGNDHVEGVTAALQSNPSILLVENSDVESAYKYAVSVEDELVSHIYFTKEHERIPNASAVNAALQSNPTVVPIETELPVNPDMQWDYDGTNFVLKD